MKKIAAFSLLAALALAGCGGDHDDTPATALVPPSASNSIDGFIEYLKELVVSPADMLEPVDVSTVVPPTDETSEPQVVD